MKKQLSVKKHGKLCLNSNENLMGYIFIMPSFILFLVFSLIPLLLTLILSFSEWDMVSGIKNIKFIGIANYKDLFSDVWFIDSFKNNILFTILTTPVLLVGGLVLAILVNKYCYGKSFFKIAYFLPYISSIVAVSTVWMVLFQPSLGPVNDFLRAIGVQDPPKWLGDTVWALPTVSMMYVWANLGYYMIIYISGLQGIPIELYEAADIDGAGWFRKFINITVPMVTPTTFFLMITGIMASFKIFDPIQIMTGGGPGSASSVLVFYLYKVSFVFYKMGYGSAIAMILFVVIFIVTYLQWQGQKKWVNYI